MELSKLQKEILEKEDKQIIVLAAAASGKTSLITEKVRQLLRAGVPPRDIAAITFTNMAAEELRLRLSEDYKEGIFIGTVHALANRFLLSSGIDTSGVIGRGDFDDLFDMVAANPDCVQSINYLLLDEAQDSSKSQITFLFEMINPDNFFIVGDLRQSIFRWAGARPDLLEDLANEPEVSCYSLNENYRNGTQILEYAKKGISKIGLIDDSISMRQFSGMVKEIQADIFVPINLIEKQKDYKNWAILTRTNEQINLVMKELQKKNIPADTFKQGDLTKKDIIQKMIDDTVKVLTIHSSKGLQWNNVVVVGAQYKKEEDFNVNYVAATRARNALFWIIGFQDNPFIKRKPFNKVKKDFAFFE